MNRRLTRVPPAAAALWLLLLCGCARAIPQTGSTAPGASAAGICSVRELSREPLLVEGGRALYVQPVILEPNGRGETLLAGDISFLLERRPPDDRWRFVREDSTFGAIIPASGEAVVVPAPIPTRLIGGARALARADGGWDVTFAQVHDYTGVDRPTTVERLWYGVLDGPRWTELEPVPLPGEPGDTLDTILASPLLRVADTLFWAAKLKRPGLEAVAIFSRRGGAWEHDTVPTGFGSYPRVYHVDSLGLTLTIVQPDRTLPADGNSLILWTRRPHWRPYRTLVPSSREQVYDPWISFAPGREVAGWVAGVEDEAGARTEAHAMSGPLNPASPVIVLDSAIHAHGMFVARPLEPAPGVRLWIFERRLADRQQSQLRLVQELAGRAVVLDSVPASFPAGFRAALPAPGQLLVAGAEYNAAERMIVSLLLRFELDCPSP